MPTITWSLQVEDPNLTPITSLTQAVERLGRATQQTAQQLAGLDRNAQAGGRSTNSLAQGTQNAARAANTAEGAFATLGSRILAIGEGLLIYRGFTTLEKVLGDVTTGIFTFAAAQEQAQVGFTNLLHSGEAATAMLADLRQFANASPFRFDQLRDYAQSLLGVGEAARKILPDLKDVGSEAAGRGLSQEQLSGVVLAYTQTLTKGKLEGQEVRQFAERLIPVVDILAQQLHKTTGEIQQMIEAGQISAQVFQEAFHADAVTNFGDAIEKQSHTWNGLISTVQDLGETFLQVFGQGVIAELEPKLEAAVRALKDPAVVATIQQWGVEFGKFLGQLWEAGKAIAVWAGLPALPDLPSVPNYDPVGDSWKDINQSLLDSTASARDFDGEIASLQGRVSNIRDQQAAIDASYQRQLTAIRGQQAAYDAGMDNRLAGLRDQARLLDQAYQSEKARRELANLGKDIAKDRLLAVDVVSSQGQAAAKRLKDELARQADLQDQYRHDQTKNDLANQEAGLQNQKRVADQGYAAQVRGIEAAKQAQDQYFAGLARGYQRQIDTLQTLKKSQADEDKARAAAAQQREVELRQWQANVTAATNEYRAAYDSTFQAVANGTGITGPQQSLVDKLFGTAAQQTGWGKALGDNAADGFSFSLTAWAAGHGSWAMDMLMGGHGLQGAVDNWLAQVGGVEDLGGQLARAMFPDWPGLFPWLSEQVGGMNGGKGPSKEGGVVGDTIGGLSKQKLDQGTPGRPPSAADPNRPGWVDVGPTPGNWRYDPALWEQLTGRKMPATKKEVYDPISGGRDPNRTYQLGGGRASGGPVYPGYAYQVGEHGPETLYMGAGSGYVQPYASHYTLPAQSVGGNSQLTVTVRTERGEVLGIVRSEFRNSSNGRYVARLLGDYAGSTG